MNLLFPHHALQSNLPTSTPNPTISYVPPPATKLFPADHQTESQPTSFSPARLGYAADLIALLALFLILYRTYRYINQRRNGLVGPTAAPLLIKFWSLYGVLECTSQLLAVYLSPFHADWLISTTRALILVLLITGSHLRVTQFLYDHKLRPFFDTHAPDIEKQFTLARKNWSDVNEACRELATYLLKRIAVGGLSNAVVMPSAQEESHPSYVQQPADSSGEAGPPLPKESAVFPTARRFFGGDSEQRAETVINAHAGSLRGPIQATIPEPPRPVYDEARAMREQFRNRLKKGKSVNDAPS